jgi:hypothetical protein
MCQVVVFMRLRKPVYDEPADQSVANRADEPTQRSLL